MFEQGTVEHDPYDEFAHFHENAGEYGIPFHSEPVVRRQSLEVAPGRHVSFLVWGEGEPEYVFLHGGGQNAHTWDTVALALGCPLVAIDLPGHGHSDQVANPGLLSPQDNAVDVAPVIRAVAPAAKAVVGMSLGGLTTIALAAHAPDLVRRAVLVDVTPGVNADKSQAISNFVRGPATFASFDDLLARTIEHNPTRTVESLRRGILHNAFQLEDGTWMWRYRRFTGGGVIGGASTEYPDWGPLWDVLQGVAAPVLLVRGMRPQSVVDDADVAELRRRLPDATVVEVAEAGHSVQGDTPLELAEIIRSFAP
ncbi:MAG: alpha/beta hydrolase [Actinomycetota bacterium]|nr:alpha/beta hydrolase [Actinomycetota bacterium]